MQWDDPVVIIAIYASIISSIILIWNIIDVIKKNKVKLKIEFHLLQSFTGIPVLGITSPVSPSAKIRIINQGSVERLINKPRLKFNKMIKLMGAESEFIEVSKINGTDKYPISLKPGDIHERIIEINSLVEKLKDQISASDKFKAVIADTYGKKYYSKKYKVQTLLNNIHLASRINEQVD